MGPPQFGAVVEVTEVLAMSLSWIAGPWPKVYNKENIKLVVK